MLSQIRKGDTLVVSKLGRLGRDSIDVLQTVRHMGKCGVKVVVLRHGNTDLTDTGRQAPPVDAGSGSRDGARSSGRKNQT